MIYVGENKLEKLGAAIRGAHKNQLTKPRVAKPKAVIIPSGAREYYFNIKGNPSTNLGDKTDSIYSCISLNEKNAIRKFKKWLSTPSL